MLKARWTSLSAISGGCPSTCLLTEIKTELSWDRGDRSGGSRTRSICCRGTVRGNSSPEGRRVLLRPAASGSWLYGCHVPLPVVAMQRHQRRLAVRIEERLDEPSSRDAAQCYQAHGEIRREGGHGSGGGE